METSKVRCVIVDDEELGINVIKSHLSKLRGFTLVNSFTNALDALSALRNLEVDLVFLDIQMPDLTGIDLLKLFKSPPKVIFTTAYRNYAVEAFDLDVIDYLVKPISLERFIKAIDKYTLRVANIQKQDHLEEHITIKSNNSIHIVPLNTILYIESMDDFVCFHTINEKLFVYDRLINLEKKLPAKSFLRIHRSYIVNLTMITNYSKTFINITGTKLPVGKSYRDRVSLVLENDILE